VIFGGGIGRLRGVSTSAADRRRTPLWAAHQALGARLIDFGGWDMPVQYPAGTLKEHKAVREAVGLFDVSHMGEAYFRGDRAREAVDRITTNAVGAAKDGKAVYTLLCRPDGGIVDDCIFYKKSDREFFVIVNAANTAKDLAWMREQVGDIVDIEDVSDATALVAVQGPKAVAMVDALAGANGALAAMPSFTHTHATIGGVACTVGRTGYTGEDGFELACGNADATRLWDALVGAATPLGGLPIGLGARDTLRLEAKLPLYGNDIDDTTTPLEAGLGWAVKLDKGEFLGRDVLVAQKAAGVKRMLVGFKVDAEARAIPRHGYDIVTDGVAVGKVTSGGPGITVGGAIGLGYVPVDRAREGTELSIDCRGRQAPARVVAGKFYKRAS
jgi:aminomethyltransferase